jgi:hypothetical protein
LPDWLAAANYQAKFLRAGKPHSNCASNSNKPAFLISNHRNAARLLTKSARVWERLRSGLRWTENNLIRAQGILEFEGGEKKEALGKTHKRLFPLHQRKPYLTGSPPSRQMSRWRPDVAWKKYNAGGINFGTTSLLPPFVATGTELFEEGVLSQPVLTRVRRLPRRTDRRGASLSICGTAKHPAHQRGTRP